MHDRPSIRGQREEGTSIRSIAKQQGASRNAVRRAIRPGARDSYYRASAIEDAEPAVRDVLADYPQMCVADVALLIDWRKSRRQLSDLVARLRPKTASEWPTVQARTLESLATGKLAAAPLRCGTMKLGELKL